MVMDWGINRSWLLRDENKLQSELSTPDLAKFDVLCLLGAAGMGKSWELTRLLDIERRNGRRVVQVQLGRESTSGDALREALRAASAQGDSVFLDALDEAMVPLRQAAGIVENWILHNINPGMSFRIACRSAVWPSILNEALEQRFGSKSRIVVDLQPLSELDFRNIAILEGMDGDAFVQAVHARNVLMLAQHPLTLSLLIREFRENEQLSESRNALFDRAVIRLCSETADRIERGTAPAVDPTLLAEAAERVAVLSVTSGREIVDLSQDVDKTPLVMHWAELSSLPFSAERVLKLERLRELAGTGLFRGAGNRKYQFLHRQLAEFLAGRRIAALPIHQAVALLASDEGWSRGVAAPLREVSAVAASLNEQVAEWIARVDPQVLGESDVASSGSRQIAFRNLLQKFREHRLTDAQVSRDQVSFEGLHFPGVEEELRQVLMERGVGLEDVHACAISLAESWELDVLSMELAALVLDGAVSLDTRKDAGYALTRIGTPKSKKLLMPLVAGVANDTNEDLKGLALRCNWPENITTTNLLKALTAPEESYYFGAYEGFLLSIHRQGFDSSDNPLAGLRWANRIVSQIERGTSLKKIADQIAAASLNHLHDGRIRKQFVNYVLTVQKTHRNFELPDDAANDYRQLLEADAELRRNLWESLLDNCKTIDDYTIWSAARTVPGLVNLADFHWLLSRAVSTPKSRRGTSYATIAFWMPWRDNVSAIEDWIAFHIVPPISTVFSIPPYVTIESAEAQRLRRAYALELQTKSSPEPEQITPSLQDRVQLSLDQAEKDPHHFSQLLAELSLTPTSTYYEFERFVTQTNGWSTSDRSTKDRIVGVAKQLLSTCDDLPQKAQRTPLSRILSDGAMASLLLLQEIDEHWLSKQPDVWWRRWCWYILRELHLHLAGEENNLKRALLDTLCVRIPATVRKHILRLAGNRQGAQLLASLLPELIHTNNDTLDDELCNMIKKRQVAKESLGTVMSFVLRRSPAKAVPVCVNRLTRTSPNRNDAPSVIACATLLSEQPKMAWQQLISFMTCRLDLARHAIEHFAAEERSYSLREVKMSPTHVGEFLNLIFTLYPPESDPKHEGAHFVSGRDAAVHLRTALLNWLSDQGNSSASQALRSLEKAHGAKYPWLRRSRASAELNQRLREWNPLPLSTTAQILEAAHKRLMRSSEDVMNGVLEALRRYDHELAFGTPPLVDDLWNTPGGQLPTPKDEEHASSKVSKAITIAFESFALTASREVQIRRRALAKSVGGNPGSEADVFVQVPPVGTTTGDSIVVVVEVKLSSNSDVKTAMRRQLVDRYMREADTDFGIYVVAFMQAPKLAKSHRPKWPSIENARKELQAQAENVLQETAGSTIVESYVLNATLN